MRIGFLNVLPKITKIRHFWSKIPKSYISGLIFTHFSFFDKTLQLEKFREVDLIYDKVFKNSSPKIHIEEISYGKFRFFFFWKVFTIRQIWGCWFQTWKLSFKIVARKHASQTFLVPNLGFFVFLQNFAVREIWGCWFQIRK